MACARHKIRAAYAIHNVALAACAHHRIRAAYAIHIDALEVYNILVVYVVVRNGERVVCGRSDNRPGTVLLPQLSAMLKRWPVKMKAKIIRLKKKIVS